MNADRAINQFLDQTEADHGTVVLFACEIGARGSGLASADSDRHVGFIYLHRPDWYLSLDPKPDVFDRTFNGDFTAFGWDLRKALLLFRRSYPVLLEWLRSPIVYRDAAAPVCRMQEWLPRYRNSRTCFYHYLHMAQANYWQYLRADEILVRKYLNVTRSLLLCRWIEERSDLPPMDFAELLGECSLDTALSDVLEKLLGQRENGLDRDWHPSIEILNAFIQKELKQLLRKKREPFPPYPEATELDTLFRRALDETWAENVGTAP